MRFGRGSVAVVVMALLAMSPPSLAETPDPAPVASVAATPRALELTRRYFAAMRMENTVTATVRAVMPQLVGQFARANPHMTAAQRAAIVDAAAQASRTMTGRLMERMAPVFAQSFSEPELEDLVAFYEGPTGQALVAKTPAFAARMQPAMTQLMPEMMAEMHTALCAKIACAAKAAAPTP